MIKNFLYGVRKYIYFFNMPSWYLGTNNFLGVRAGGTILQVQTVHVLGKNYV
jgi:hypothetical protein